MEPELIRWEGDLTVKGQHLYEPFVLLCDYQDRDIAASAGFRFNYEGVNKNSQGKSERVWYTTKPEIAAKLKNYAQGPLYRELMRVGEPQKPRVSLRHEKGAYVFRSPKEMEAKPREAGFIYEPTENNIAPYWYTEDPYAALQLIEYADDATRAQLKQMAAQYDLLRAASRATRADFVIPRPAELDYLPYQYAGIQFGARVFNSEPSRGLLIGDDPGLGKTLEAIGLINLIPSIQRVLVVCPASLRINWLREFQRWLVRDLVIEIATPETRNFRRADVWIINYEQLHRHIEFSQKGNKIKVRSLGRLGGDWDFVIVDEAHLIKNPDARRSVLTLALTEKVREAGRHVAMLTGTPIVNRVKELFTLIHNLDPVSWPSAYRYESRYCGVTSNARLGELQDKLRATIFLRRKKSEVLTELPPKLRQVIEISTPDSLARKISARLRQDEQIAERLGQLKAAVELAKASDEPADYEQAVLALQSSRSVAFGERERLRHEEARDMLPYAIQHVDALIEDDPAYKVIVFAWNADVLNAMARHFGSKAVIVTGETDSKTKLVAGRETSARQEAVDRFQTDASCQVFIGNIKAAGVGLTLTASSHVVFFQLDDVPGNITQAEDRAHRWGQKDSVLVQHLVFEDSIAVKMAHNIVEKQRVIDLALDGQTGSAGQISEMPIATEELRAATQSISRKQIERDAARLTGDQIEAVHLGLRRLAEMSDGAGFSNLDCFIGQQLAALESLSPRQAALGAKLALRYSHQLPATLLATITGEAASLAHT